MPIYEYYCPDNHKIYSFLARTLADGEKVPRCPDDPAFRMQKAVSLFSVKKKPETLEQPAGGPGGEDMDDPRMEKMLAEMEREFSGMDEENPDPRQLGRMMRRMAEMTGEKLPAEWNEMVGRMEAGEDPEKLEEEYGDVLDDMDGPEGMEGMGGMGGPGAEGEGGTSSEESGPGAPTPSRLRKLLRRHRPPARDPQLYELRDYVDAS